MPSRETAKQAKPTGAERGSSSAAAAKDYAWPPINKIPLEPPQVVLAFHGLMGFAYNKSRRLCEVGMHSTASTHEFAIEVYDHIPEDKNDKPFYTYDYGYLGSPEAPNLIELDVVSAEPKYCPPRFYMNMKSYDLYDFRRMVDFESELLHKKKLQLNSSVFKARLRLKTGVFLTGRATEKHFYRVADKDRRCIHQIAEILVAPIYHKTGEGGGYVALRMGQHELKLLPRGGSPYVIAFKNLCPRDHSDTTARVQDTRNDLHLYYDTFHIPDGQQEYEFIREGSEEKIYPPLDDKEKCKPEDEYTPELPQWLTKFKPFFDRSSRESPCGGAGFGKTESGLSSGS